MKAGSVRRGQKRKAEEESKTRGAAPKRAREAGPDEPAAREPERGLTNVHFVTPRPDEDIKAATAFVVQCVLLQPFSSKPFAKVLVDDAVKSAKLQPSGGATQCAHLVLEACKNLPLTEGLLDIVRSAVALLNNEPSHWAPGSTDYLRHLHCLAVSLYKGGAPCCKSLDIDPDIKCVKAAATTSIGEQLTDEEKAKLHLCCGVALASRELLALPTLDVSAIPRDGSDAGGTEGGVADWASTVIAKVIAPAVDGEVRDQSRTSAALKRLMGELKIDLEPPNPPTALGDWKPVLRLVLDKERISEQSTGMLKLIFKHAEQLDNLSATGTDAQRLSVLAGLGVQDAQTTFQVVLQRIVKAKPHNMRSMLRLVHRMSGKHWEHDELIYQAPDRLSKQFSEWNFPEEPRQDVGGIVDSPSDVEGPAQGETGQGENESKGDTDTQYSLESLSELDAIACWPMYALAATKISAELAQVDLKGELGLEVCLCGVVNSAFALLGLIASRDKLRCVLCGDAETGFLIRHGQQVRILPLKADRTAMLKSSPDYSFWFHETKPNKSGLEDDRKKLKFMFTAQARRLFALELVHNHGSRLHEFIQLPSVLLTQQVGADLFIKLGKCQLGANRELILTVESLFDCNVAHISDARRAAKILQDQVQNHIAVGMKRAGEYLADLTRLANETAYARTSLSASRSKTEPAPHDDSSPAGSGSAEGQADDKRPGPADDREESDDDGKSPSGAPKGDQLRHNMAAINTTLPLSALRDTSKAAAAKLSQELADLAALEEHGWRCSPLFVLTPTVYRKRVYRLGLWECMKVVPTGTVEGKILFHLKKKCHRQARAVRLFGEHQLGKHGVALRMLLCEPFPILDSGKVKDGYMLLIQLVKAIQGWHEAGVFHRDIKPSNLGSLHQCEVVILDAGSAWWRSAPGGCSLDHHNRQLKARVGTEGYMAPELNGHHKFTPACDVYSLGVTLEKLVDSRRGTNRFKAVLDIAARMQASNPCDRPSLSDTLRQLLCAASQRCPDDSWWQSSKCAASQHYPDDFLWLEPTEPTCV